MRRRNSRWTITVLLGALLLAATPATAQAASIEYNPWGCSTRTDYPHLSTHYPGTVAAYAEHSCTGYWGPDRLIQTYPDWQTLEAWLYYESCFLIICSWNQVDHSATGTIYRAAGVLLSRTLAANCNNSNTTRWRLYATGSSYGWNGSQYQTYYSQNEAINTLSCGR